MKTTGLKDSSGNTIVVGYASNNTAISHNSLRVGAKTVVDPTQATGTDGYKSDILTDINGRTWMRSASYDTVAAADRVAPVYSDADRYDYADLSQTTNVNDGTTSYYIDMEGYDLFSLFIKTLGAGVFTTATVTISASNDAATQDITARTYYSIHPDLFNGAAYTSYLSGYKWLLTTTSVCVSSIKIDIASSASNANQWTALFRKMKS